MEITTKYFIDYVCPVDAYGNQSLYHQLVRTKDDAILYANPKLDYVLIECWKRGINKKEVTIL